MLKLRDGVRPVGSSSWLVGVIAMALLGLTCFAGPSGSQAQTPTPLPRLTVTPDGRPVSSFTNIGVTYFVDNDSGDDRFDCLAPTASSVTPSLGSSVDGPCKTIQHAVDLTRDRDLVVVASQEPIQLAAAIEVSDLIGIVATGFVPTFCQNTTGERRCFDLPHCEDVVGGSKVVLQSVYGGPVFHIKSAGMSSLHALVEGFIVGGTTSFDSPGAITLDHDAFTELGCNIIGQEDLPNVIGILTNSSEHPWIHDNTVHGSSQFPISTVLGPAPPVGGFGLVTDECLGASSRTDQLDIESNYFGFNSNAGIWICSDGSGGHLLRDNNIRENGRGIVLLDAVDTTLRNNYIGDNYYDGVDLLEASEDNLLDGNTIESQEGPSSTGVLLQGSGVIFPLGNTFRGNDIRRNRVDVLVAGARGTRFIDNNFTAIAERTAVLLTIGNDSGGGGPDFAQPVGTVFRTNKLYADGVCTALNGCAIRLLPGVDVSIDAVGNDFGSGDSQATRAAIWDQEQDPELGLVVIDGVAPPLDPSFSGSASEVTAQAGQGGRRRATAVTVTPFPLATSGPPRTGAATPAAIAGSQPVSTATPPASSTAAASDSGSPPVAYIDPATGRYYVELTLCVTDAGGQPVANDAMTLSLFDGANNALGVAHAQADAQGCFSGDIAAQGAGAQVQPATLAVSDSSGATLNLQVTLGAPPTRPPKGQVVSG